MILLTDGIFVHLIDFGVNSVSETVTQNADGTFSIFINARLDHETQQRAYIHALAHIYRNDFEKFDVDTIEYECHKIA